MTPLCELARKYETDKGGQHYRYGGGDSDTNHNYTPVYHELFGTWREQVSHVLEIGINAGSSLKMWQEYFPYAHIVGIDCDPGTFRHTKDDPRISCHLADQNNPVDLYKVMDSLDPARGRFQLIIDDGSHVREHQVTSMKTLLPYLSLDGIYVVEDIGTMAEPPEALPLAVLPGFKGKYRKIVGGLGWKVQPFEWLYIVRRDPPLTL